MPGRVVLLASLLAGCGRNETSLLDRPATLWVPGIRLEIGTESSKPDLLEGWWDGPEQDGQGPFRWALGSRSRLQLVVPEPAAHVQLQVAPADFPDPPVQSLQFRLDGIDLGTRQLRSGWQEVRLELPSGRPPGLSELEIVPLRVTTPGPSSPDPRPLTFRARWLELGAAGLPPASSSVPTTGAPALSLPCGAVWAVPLIPGPSAEVELRFRHSGPGSGLARLSWQGPRGIAELARCRMHGQMLGRRLMAGLPANEPGRLFLTCSGVSGAIELTEALLRQEARPAERPPAAVQARPRNLLIYLFDALRADVLGAYGMARPTSPQFDRLARDGRQFQRLAGHSAWTRPAVATLFTGLYPWNHRVQRRDDALAANAWTLAELFAEEGFFTAAIAGNANVAGAFGFGQGFERFVEGYTLADVLRLHPENPKLRSDDLGMQAARALDEAGQRPFFLFLHSVDPHHPYVPPAPVADFEGPQAESQVEAQAQLYRAAVRFNDAELGKVLDLLEARGLTDSTLLVLIADHGEEFWDHGGIHHGQTLYEEITRIPLVLAGPGVEPGIEPRPLAMADLAPSLLHAFGFLEPDSAAAASHDGRVLGLQGPRQQGEEWLAAEELLDGRSVGALGIGRYKLIRNRGRFHLFDLADDPGERTDLSGQDPLRRRALEAELQMRTRADRPLSAGKVDESKLDKRIEAELRALGYIE